MAKINSTRAHLYKVLRKVKVTETESRRGLAGTGERGDTEVVFIGCEVSVWEGAKSSGACNNVNVINAAQLYT